MEEKGIKIEKSVNKKICKERPKEDCKTVQSKLIEINDPTVLQIKVIFDG